MNISRRGFLLGAAAVVAAPAIVRTPGLIMPIKPIIPARQDIPLVFGRGHHMIAVKINDEEGYRMVEYIGEAMELQPRGS